MSKHSSDPYYEPVQVIKSFRVGTGSSTAAMCERVIKYMVEEKNRQLYLENPKHPTGTKFKGEVIMAGESVRVNLYNAIDKDAMTFGVYYERAWKGQL